MDMLSRMGWMFQTCALKLDNNKQSAEPRFSLPIVKSCKFSERLTPA